MRGGILGVLIGPVARAREVVVGLFEELVAEAIRLREENEVNLAEHTQRAMDMFQERSHIPVEVFALLGLLVRALVIDVGPLSIAPGRKEKYP